MYMQEIVHWLEANQEHALPAPSVHWGWSQEGPCGNLVCRTSSNAQNSADVHEMRVQMKKKEGGREGGRY